MQITFADSLPSDAVLIASIAIPTLTKVVLKLVGVSVTRVNPGATH